MRYLYFPGCSLKGTSRSYEEALLAVFSKLGVELEELDDWNCCGATAIIAVSDTLSLALAARNLALAELTGLTMITPCPSCWLSLTKANRACKKEGLRAADVSEALASGNITYNGTTKVRHILEFLVNEVGAQEINKAVTAPLTGLRVAPYYGCQIVRPYAEGDESSDPQNLEQLIRAVGAEVAPFELKAACCSGALMATRPAIGKKMSAQILRSIGLAEADVVVTACPLCQLNLELAQDGSNASSAHSPLPILTIPQLMGVAMQIPFEDLGFSRSLHPNATKHFINSQEQRIQFMER